MQQPTSFQSRRLADGTVVLRSFAPLPGLGVLAVNAFLVPAHEPVLIDTGMSVLHDGFMRELRRHMDPAELRWIWITHADADHVGNLRAVLAAAPMARIVTNYLGVGKLGLQQIPPERTWLLNPGQALGLGDRQLLAFRPPVYDAPETMGAFDMRSGYAYTSDCFGAVLEQPQDTADAVDAAELARGLTLWASIDAPWLSRLDARAWENDLRELRARAPAMVLSSHLPAAAGMNDVLFETLARARHASPFVGPDQAAMERSLSETVAA